MEEHIHQRVKAIKCNLKREKVTLMIVSHLNRQLKNNLPRSNTISFFSGSIPYISKSLGINTIHQCVMNSVNFDT